MDKLRNLRRAGKDDALHARVVNEPCADLLAASRQKLQSSARNAGLVQQFDGGCSDQRSLFGRLREYWITSRERRAHLPDKYRERKIPWANADHWPKRPGPEA